MSPDNLGPMRKLARFETLDNLDQIGLNNEFGDIGNGIDNGVDHTNDTNTGAFDDIDTSGEKVCEGVEEVNNLTPPGPASMDVPEEVQLDLDTNWCSLNYYELSSKIGETFHANGNSVKIDGFCDPSTKTDRFSLGLLSNINRAEATRFVRKVIGQGIELVWKDNFVTLRCLSKHQVFIQSPNCNSRYGWDLSTVIKVPPNCTLTIFDMTSFSKDLAESIPKGFEAVYALARMCSVRISFVKGWGRDYRRQSVINCPSWLELRLNGPLRWIDVILKELQAPDVDNITSMS